VTDTTTTTAALDEPPLYRWRWFALAVILAAEVMDLLDSTIIGIAAPSIQEDLGGTYTSIQWLAAGYTLTYAIGLITGGRLGDIYGRRRIFLIGVVGFTVVSALCGLAPGVGSLIGLRLLQGVFAALMIPQGFGIVRTIFPPRELPSAFGLFGPVIGLSAVLGPIVAGALVSADVLGTGWRMVFLINVPLGLLALAGALRFLPESRSSHPLRLDVVGMVLVVVATLMLVYPLVQGRELDWPAWCFALMAGSLPVFAVFAWYEVRKQRRDRSALVVPSLFLNKAYVSGLLVMLIFFGAMAGLMLVFGLYLQLGLLYTPVRAGLTMAPFAVGLALGSALSGAVLARRFGRRTLHAGVVTLLVGTLVLYATLGRHDLDLTSLQVVPGLAVSGFGIGLLISPLFSFALGEVGHDEVGSASGVLNANQQLGSTVGVAVLGTIFFTLLTPAGGFTHAMRAVLLVVAGLVVVVFALGFLLPRRLRTTEPEADGAPGELADA